MIWCVSKARIPACRKPLIELCSEDGAIKLDLGGCDSCWTTPAGLWIFEGGCPEYEYVCEPQEPKYPCCNVIDNRPLYWPNKHWREIAKESIEYPLHNIDEDGMCVFLLDDKMQRFKPGRLNATAMYRDAQETKFGGAEFEIDWQPVRSRIYGTGTIKSYPDLEGC